jgi:hypothetical protein
VGQGPFSRKPGCGTQAGGGAALFRHLCLAARDLRRYRSDE